MWQTLPSLTLISQHPRYVLVHTVQYCHNGTAWELKLATPNTDICCYTYLSGTENRRQSFFQKNYFRQFRDVWGFKKLPTFSRSCCYRAGHTKQLMRQLWHRQNMYWVENPFGLWVIFYVECHSSLITLTLCSLVASPALHATFRVSKGSRDGEIGGLF